jgi:glycosyltransferase involved in cell wall biosynthesis
VVEAMAAGAVPIVFAAAGPAEIVQDGDNGRHWTTLDELADETVRLVDDAARRDELAAAAIRRATDFSATAFADRLSTYLSADISPVAPVPGTGDTQLT